MSDALRFKITDGVLAFSVVDPAAVGYSDAWQSPAGKAVNLVTLADYTEADAQWSCQVSTATIDASADTTTESVEATWCAPAKTTPNPGETSFTINATFFQDVADDAGLWAFLYANDTAEAFFYMGLGGDAAPPAAIGRCRITAATFGGAGQVSLTATLSCPVSRRYDAWIGTGGAGNSSVILADGTVTPILVAQAATAEATDVDGSPLEADAA
jgi:hypothetical protein